MDNQEDSVSRHIINNNQDSFYEKEFAIDRMKLCAIDRGLDTGCDIELVFPHLSSSHNLLEIGAAYGRVLEHLQRLEYRGKITAIEKSQRFFTYLTMHYSDHAELIHEDILNYHPKQKFDVILYMWTGISDFMPAGQVRVLQNLKSLLAVQGKIFIEIIYTNTHPQNFQLLEKQLYEINERGCIGNYHIPSLSDLTNLAEKNHLKIQEQIIYKTPKNIQRCIYILTHH